MPVPTGSPASVATMGGGEGYERGAVPVGNRGIGGENAVGVGSCGPVTEGAGNGAAGAGVGAAASARGGGDAARWYSGDRGHHLGDEGVSNLMRFAAGSGGWRSFFLRRFFEVALLAGGGAAALPDLTSSYGPNQLGGVCGGQRAALSLVAREPLTAAPRDFSDAASVVRLRAGQTGPGGDTVQRKDSAANRRHF